MHLIFNIAEALLWLAIAVMLLVRRGSMPSEYRNLASIAAGTFVLFAGTDIAETFTRAWYRPWWLLLANVGCFFTLASCYVRYRVIRRRLDDSS